MNEVEVHYDELLLKYSVTTLILACWTLASCNFSDKTKVMLSLFWFRILDGPEQA